LTGLREPPSIRKSGLLGVVGVVEGAGELGDDAVAIGVQGQVLAREHGIADALGRAEALVKGESITVIYADINL
jgi:hypothetical protein